MDDPLRCPKTEVGLPIELAVVSGLWLGQRNCLGPIEVFPKAPLCKGLAMWGGPYASKWPKMEKWSFLRKIL